MNETTHEITVEIPVQVPQATNDMRRLRGVLLQIAQLAREASLSGCLEKGSRSAALQYNRILKSVEENGIGMAGLFEPLDENTSFDEIGVAAAQLAGFLEIDERPPLPSPFPLTSTQAPDSGAPESAVDRRDFEHQEMDKLKGLGQMIREQLPEWIKREVESKLINVQGQIEEAERNAKRFAERHTDQKYREDKMKSKHATQRLSSSGTQKLSEGQGEEAGTQRVDTSGARFQDTNRSDAAFHDVNFDNVEFNDVNFSNVLFRDVNMANAQFHDTNMANAQFHDTSFANCKFNDAEYSNTEFHDVSFANAQLHDCDVSGMKINGVSVEELLKIHSMQ